MKAVADTEDTLTLLLQRLSNQDFAANAAGYLGGTRAWALLARAQTDLDRDVRRAVARTLGEAGAQADEDAALALLKKLLADRERVVRWQAAEALAQWGGRKAYALLLAALKNERDHLEQHHLIEVLRARFRHMCRGTGVWP